MKIHLSSHDGRADLFDASALVRLYVAEPGYEKVRAHFNDSPTKYTTPYCFYETLGALKNYWIYKKKLDRNQYLDAAFHLSAWYSASASQITDLNFTDSSLLQSARLIVQGHDIDLSDAFQILSVKLGFFSRLINESQTLLVTADKGLAAAARSQALRVWSVLEDEIILSNN